MADPVPEFNPHAPLSAQSLDHTPEEAVADQRLVRAIGVLHLRGRPTAMPYTDAHGRRILHLTITRPGMVEVTASNDLGSHDVVVTARVTLRS